MSIRILNSASLKTATSSGIGTGRARASAAFLLRVDAPTPMTSSDYSGAWFWGHVGTQGLIVRPFSVDQANQTMTLDCSWRAANSVGLSYRPIIYPGIVYAVVMTYDRDDPSNQAVYVNGVKYQMAPTQSETLSTVAAKYHTTVAVLASLNHITNINMIFVGQVLKVPCGASAAGGSSGAVVKVTPPAAPSEPVTPGLGAEPRPSYTVKTGDTLSSIAARTGTSVNALMQANGIRDANRIYAGQTLRLP